MRDTIDGVLDPEGSPNLLREHYRKQADDNTEKMYRNWCGTLMSMWGPEADLPKEPGMLLRLCDGDATFLRTLAAMGSMCGPLFGEAELEEICQQTGLTAA
jgi:hypothetical protein